MLKRILAAGLVIAVASPLIADTTVLHVGGHTSGWRGSYNYSASYCWLDGWPNNGADAAIADFDRAALQNAINTQLAASGGWNAKLIVTQVGWTGNPAIPSNLGPVAGVIDIDPTTFVWGGSWAFNAGAGNWAFGGTSYANFVAAYNASAAAGKSFLFTLTTSQWTSYKDAGMPDPNVWNVAIDIPEVLVVRYLNNPNAEGFFVSATIASPGISIYQGDQWGGIGDMRVLIAAPPTTAPWLNASILSLTRTIALTSPTYSQAVTVTNAGSGTINWTASESPDVSWLSLTNATGTAGQQFQINLDVTGQAVGTYTTNVLVSDSAAANSPVTIPVTVTVVSTAQPIIQLAPASLTFTARPADVSDPPVQYVTVNNTGLGTLAWTAAQQAPPVSWLSLSPSSGGNGGQLGVRVYHAGLAAGVYTKNVLVSDPAASNSPQTLTVTFLIQDQDADIAKANSYDDAWQSGDTGWIATMRQMRVGATGKTDGFIVLLGDSITYANPFSQWPRYGSGKTAADTTICNWMHAADWGTGSNNSNNGWYLAAYDVPSRGGSFTAKSGITSGQYLAGTYGLPSMDQMFTAGFTNPDGKQYRDALMAVILLGTNDIGGGNTAQLTANLGSIIDKLLAAKVIPILTTLPPRVGADTTVGNFNTAIRNLAQTRAIPLIDYWAEITRRRPGTSWQNTLISSDGVHPSSTGGAYNSSSDPYVNSGEALSNVGYLLRSWLTVQKIAEVKAAVIDLPPPPPAPSNPNPPNNATGVSTSPTLTWSGAGPGITFNVYFSATYPPVLKASGQSAASYVPGSLSKGVAYYWQVVAVSAGGSTPGPIWDFITEFCPGDLNEDGYVGQADFGIFQQAFGYQVGEPGYNADADYDGDGVVTLADYQTFVWYLGSQNCDPPPWPAPDPIPARHAEGDASGDGAVDVTDLLIVAEAWGTSVGADGYEVRADFNTDGQVDVSDLLTVADNFGT
jgi:lysophospholipase L1-like esterase